MREACSRAREERYLDRRERAGLARVCRASVEGGSEDETSPSEARARHGGTSDAQGL